MKVTAWMMSLSVAATLASYPVFADPPQGKGGGKQQGDVRGNAKGKHRDDAQRQDSSERRDEGGREHGQHEASPQSSVAVSRHFDGRQRSIVREFYVAEYRSGHCPPGLAKKNNGCMPPGQAKKWSIGRPLPQDVIFYDLPPVLAVRIGTPPPGYRYVRVAADILLIAIGTAMVVDAVIDLGNI